MASISPATRAQAARIIATCGALVGAGALILQFVLIKRLIAGMGGGLMPAASVFFGFFTMWSNIAATTLLAAGALRPRSRHGLGDARALLAIASAMTISGFVYTLVIRPLLNPQGLQNFAEILLHHVTPVFFVAFFLLRGEVTRWRDALWALALPILYCAFALTRGHFDGWYPYPFLNAHALSFAQLATNIAALAFAFWIAALALAAIARRLSNTAARA